LRDVGRISQKGAIVHQFFGAFAMPPDQPLLKGMALRVLIIGFPVFENGKDSKGIHVSGFRA